MKMNFQKILLGITLTLITLNGLAEDYSLNLVGKSGIDLSKIQVSESDGAAVGMYCGALYFYNKPTPFNQKTGYFSLSYTTLNGNIPRTYTRRFSLSPDKMNGDYMILDLSVSGPNAEFPLCVQNIAATPYLDCKLDNPSDSGNSGCPTMVLSLPKIDDGIAMCPSAI